MTKQSLYTNALNAQERQEKALQKAKEQLKAIGVEYPSSDPTKSPQENYEALQAYAKLESDLMIKLLKEPSGPRPIAFDSTKQKESRNWYD